MKGTRLFKSANTGKGCYLCSAILGVYRHHIKPKSEGGSDNTRNIVYLCEECHNLVEEDPSLLLKRKYHILNLTQDNEGYPYYVIVQQGNNPFLVGICHAWGMEYILQPITEKEILNLIM